MDLNQLLVFAKVAEMKSFTSAAKQLQLEKSTVSVKVSQLEQRLGTRLLNRTTRSVSLTEVGEEYYLYCQQIIESVKEADEFAQSTSNEPKGVVRISASPGIQQILTTDILEPFLRKYEKITAEVHITDRLVDLAAERFDLVLRGGIDNLKDSSLIAKQLMASDLGFFASPCFIERHGRIDSLQKLETLPFVRFHKHQKLEISRRKGKNKFQLHTNNRLVINDVTACLAAIQSGVGIGILPVKSVANQVSSGLLVQVAKGFTLEKASLYVIYQSRKCLPLKVRVFLEHLLAWSERRSQFKIDPTHYLTLE